MPATIYNLGSINRDTTIGVERFPLAGETLPGEEITQALGGKGLNISIALHRAGNPVRHIGAVHVSDDETLDEIRRFGLETSLVERSRQPTGKAFILLDRERENTIVLCPGANTTITEDHVDNALASACQGDWLVLQNETNCQHHAANLAHERGMHVALVAAPFDVELVVSLREKLNLIVMNEVEATQLEAEIGLPISEFTGPALIVTKGSRGATLFDNGERFHQPGKQVKPVDTTAAGDTFLGYFLGARLAGLSDDLALERANAAAALAVQKPGASPSIPKIQDVLNFIKEGDHENNS